LNGSLTLASWTPTLICSTDVRSQQSVCVR
jgi:hypothetical protein